MESNLRYFGDRRRRPTPALSRYTLFGGRRAAVRRATDSQRVYVDHLGTGLSTILLLIFVFHILDALFTLAHVARGGSELNPLMDFFLRIGPTAFIVAKLGMAGAGLVFLALHARWPLVRQGIATLFILYAAVVCYHFVLIWKAGASFWQLAG